MVSQLNLAVISRTNTNMHLVVQVIDQSVAATGSRGTMKIEWTKMVAWKEVEPYLAHINDCLPALGCTCGLAKLLEKIGMQQPVRKWGSQQEGRVR